MGFASRHTRFEMTETFELISAICSAGLVAWGVLAWFLDKKHENDKVIESLKKQNQDQNSAEIRSIIQEMKQRMAELEVLQTNMSAANMKQFHSLELAMKDYSKDVCVQSEQIKQQKSEIEKLWKTVVTEIAPGVFRVSDKK